MTVVFLFGAGASYGNPHCIPHPPPLGIQLFDALACEGGIASTIKGDLAKTFRFDFELGMAEFFRTRNTELTQFQIELAKYFLQFKPGRSNYYRELIKICRNAQVEPVYATTNYDLLIELSASRVGLKISYAGTPKFANNINVLKIHGSCNFLPDMLPRQVYNISFQIPEGSAILDAPVRPATVNEAKLFCQRENALAPAMAMYAAGKGVLHCPEFIRQQQRDFSRVVEQADRVYVIGLKVNKSDEHIWSPLAEARGWLGYVGLEEHGFRQWSEDHQRQDAYIVAKTFESALDSIRSDLER